MESKLPTAHVELILSNCVFTSSLDNNPFMAVSVYSKSARFLKGAHGQTWGLGWKAEMISLEEVESGIIWLTGLRV